MVFVHDLAVSLIPSRAADVDIHLAWQFDEATRCGLHIRHCIAAPTDGTGAAHTLHIGLPTWASVLAGHLRLVDVQPDALDDGSLAALLAIDHRADAEERAAAVLVPRSGKRGDLIGVPSVNGLRIVDSVSFVAQ